MAIKTLKDDYIPTNREEFLREARLMMALNHHCIVRIIGLSEGPPLLMVSLQFLNLSWFNERQLKFKKIKWCVNLKNTLITKGL